MTNRKRVDAQASTPYDYSWKSWRRALTALITVIGAKNLHIYSAGIAYFSVLSFFPLVAVLVALAGLVIQPHQLDVAASQIAQYLPNDVAALVTSQLQSAVTHQASSWILLIVGIILSVLGVSGAVGNLMTALNHSYGVKETRHWVRQRLISIELTIFLIVGALLLGALFASGSWLENFGAPHILVVGIEWARWVIMIVGAMFGLSVLYRLGPCRSPLRKWQWVSWGAIIATMLWILVSILFFIYLQYFGNYSKNYSAYAGIIGLMVWINYSALVVLLGAEINHRFERA